MINYSEKELRRLKKNELVAICVENCYPYSDEDSRNTLINIILSRGEDTEGDVEIVDAAVPVVEEEDAQLSRLQKQAYEAELARRLGGRQAASYEAELARRRGAGSHISGADAMRLEIERRRKAFGK